MKHLHRLPLLVALVAGLGACGRGTMSADSELDRFTQRQLDGSGGRARTLYLTFDDGPGERTRELARFLAQENIPATFFVVGNQAKGDPTTLQLIQQLGHLVANHSYSHSAMTSSADPLQELARTDQSIRKYVTDSIFLFRAPYGDWSARIPDILNSNYSRYVGPIFWDIGGEGNGFNGSFAADWKCWADGASVSTCAEGYLRETEVQGRGIVLFHDTHSQSIELVKRLIPIWKARGYRFEALDQIPEIAQGLRNSGATPLEDLTPGAIECPVGYRQEAFGRGFICTEGENVLGPFTESMTKSCEASGGGKACRSMRWHRTLVTSFRGQGVCSQGARLDRLTRYCVEGNNAFGPFPENLVNRCLAEGQSEQVCNSARWNLGFLRSLIRS